MSQIRLTKIDFTKVETPEAGKAEIGLDITDGLLKMKIETGEVVLIGGGGTGGSTWIDSVNFSAIPNAETLHVKYSNGSYCAPWVDVVYDEAGAISMYRTLSWTRDYGLAYCEYGISGERITLTKLADDTDIADMFGFAQFDYVQPIALWEYQTKKGSAIRFALIISDSGGKTSTVKFCVGFYVEGGLHPDASVAFSKYTNFPIGRVCFGDTAAVFMSQDPEFLSHFCISGYASQSMDAVQVNNLNYQGSDITEVYDIVAKDGTDTFYALASSSTLESSFVMSYDFSAGFDVAPTSVIKFSYASGSFAYPVRMSKLASGVLVSCDNRHPVAGLTYVVPAKVDGTLQRQVELQMCGIDLSEFKYNSVLSCLVDGIRYVAISKRDDDGMHLFQTDPATNLVFKSQIRQLPMFSRFDPTNPNSGELHGHLNARFIADADKTKLLVPPSSSASTANYNLSMAFVFDIL